MKKVMALVVGAALLAAPYLVIQSINALYQTGVSFGWDHAAAGVTATGLTFTSIISASITAYSIAFD